MFNERLIALRKAKKLSQYELADQLNFTRGQIANYEQGKRKPDIDTLKKIATFFNVSLDYLTGGDHIPTHENNPDLKTILANETAHWNGKPLTPKQRELALELLTTVFERVESDDTTEEVK
ncbi:helix-turn-helix domain-containing protein [Laceyella sacchari]|jgi:transcriptional regulator with XRE-family HTH domain|uniref:Helix-turn-helix domain-containing protein n=1 Tax=Laceyella sacchari TaxID=37482 RepID=A0ABY5U980_LACSH|nr:helix-turn-helix transcriptional regulator [Laceyella sacchari]KPC75514.1 hypothetical protein ADL26_07450 [Thermoactinomyces vulgaris]UWE04877.1 helix-turn-helix domain-containing protein [Laceyella sacchari]